MNYTSIKYFVIFLSHSFYHYVWLKNVKKKQKEKEGKKDLKNLLINLRLNGGVQLIKK